ncbi:MAG TPA: hypothetical protein VI685_04870 [Candidatus Angelobacter sp.]
MELTLVELNSSQSPTKLNSQVKYSDATCGLAPVFHPSRAATKQIFYCAAHKLDGGRHEHVQIQKFLAYFEKKLCAVCNRGGDACA